jgi:hypothetical protein
MSNESGKPLYLHQVILPKTRQTHKICISMKNNDDLRHLIYTLFMTGSLKQVYNRQKLASLNNYLKKQESILRWNHPPITRMFLTQKVR